MLQVEGLTVRYGDHLALDRVDLSVAEREVVCVLGPSGSGKSTLLRAIAGLETSSAGRITVDGRDLAGVAPHRRDFGLMFQDHVLFPHRDVLGNVRFGLQVQGVPRPDADERAGTVLALVGLTGFEHRRVSKLSGGEQQRVALARSLAPAPRLLMLDEPLGSLDRPLRERLTVELGTLFHELGQAALFVTHDHDEAFALADRLVILFAGRVEQAGPPDEVARRPATPAVARFLGWNVTSAFGQRLAVPPNALTLNGTGGGVAGRVVATLRRRDAVRVQVAVHEAETLDVEVRGGDIPGVGSTVTLTVDEARVWPL